MDYKQKYLKYKNKYIQLAGAYECNTHILDINRCLLKDTGVFLTFDDCMINITCNNEYNNNYIELYNYLLILVNDKIDINIDIIQRLCLTLITNYELVYIASNQQQQRNLKYNMRFIINIISLLIDNTEINELIKQYTKKQNLDTANFYFMEDCYTDDIELFFDEYERLKQENKSSFFFKSNLVNLSILFKCFSDRCIDNITSDNGFYFIIKSKISNFNIIFDNFNLIKYELIKLLLDSYKNYEYHIIKKLYSMYLIFYNTNFKMLKNDDSDNKLIKIIDIIDKSAISNEDDNMYFIYLSCIIPSKPKFVRFDFTRILTSYIGFRINNDGIYNSLDLIYHDMYDHNQYMRKLSYTNNELTDLKILLIQIYGYFNIHKDIYLEYIHNQYYELSTRSKLSLNTFINKSIDKFIFTKSDLTNLINILYIQYKIDKNIKNDEIDEKTKLHKLKEYFIDKQYLFMYVIALFNNTITTITTNSKKINENSTPIDKLQFNSYLISLADVKKTSNNQIKIIYYFIDYLYKYQDNVWGTFIIHYQLMKFIYEYNPRIFTENDLYNQFYINLNILFNTYYPIATYISL